MIDQPADVAVGHRVCVVTPVFNGERYLDETIASVLGQTGMFTLHYHIQDGGSSDGTLEVVERWLSRHRLGLLPLRCKGIEFTFASEPDGGMYDAVNRGFARVLPPGDDVIMGWIAADDLIAPGAFATIMAVRRQHPDVRFVGGRISLLDEHGSITAVSPMRGFSPRMLAAGLYDGRDGRSFVMQEGSFWCADVWHAVGGLEGRYRLAGDWDLWRRMATYADYVSLDSVLGFHRRRPGQMSEQISQYYEEIDAALDEPIERSALFSTNRQMIDAGLIDADERTTRRVEYDAIAREHDRLLADPLAYRASGHATTAMRFDMGLRLWQRVNEFGAPQLETDVVDDAGNGRHLPVLVGSGFGFLEDARPDLGMAEKLRWLRTSPGCGEVVLAKDGFYEIVVRYRAWDSQMIATFWSDGVVLATRALPAHGHVREVEIRVGARLTAGRRQLAITIEHPDRQSDFFILMGWTVRSHDREVLQPVEQPGLLPLTGMIEAAHRDCALPRILAIVSVTSMVGDLTVTLEDLAWQNYSELEIIIALQDGAALPACDPRVIRYVTGSIVAAPNASVDEMLALWRDSSAASAVWPLRAGDRLGEGALQLIARMLRDPVNAAVRGVVDWRDALGGIHQRVMPEFSDEGSGGIVYRLGSNGRRVAGETADLPFSVLTRPHPPTPVPYAYRGVAYVPAACGNGAIRGVARALFALGLEIRQVPDGVRASSILEDRALDRLMVIVDVPDASSSGRTMFIVRAGQVAPEHIELPSGIIADPLIAHGRLRARMLIGAPANGLVVAVPSDISPANLERMLVACRKIGRDDVAILYVPQEHMMDGAQASLLAKLTLQAADIFVSDESSHAGALIAAAACGLPIVAISRASEMNQDLVDIALLPDGEADDAELLRLAASDPLWRERVGAKARLSMMARSGPLACAIWLDRRLARGAHNPMREMVLHLAPFEAMKIHRYDDPTLPIEDPPETICIEHEKGVRRNVLLLQAPESRRYTVQFAGRAGLDMSRCTVVVNGRMLSSESQPAQPSEWRVTLPLHAGFNRLELLPSELDRNLPDLPILGMWPAAETTSDALPDGLVVMHAGFGTIEPPAIASLLPNPFYRALRRHTSILVASQVAAERWLELRLRNLGRRRRFTVGIGGRILASLETSAPRSELLRLPMLGFFDTGFNSVSIVVDDFVLDELDRPVAFLMEGAAFVARPREDQNLIRWDESRGVGPLEAPSPEEGLLTPFRWIEADSCTIVLDQVSEGNVELALTCRCLSATQRLSIHVNDRFAADITFDPDAFAKLSVVRVEARLNRGRNILTLAFHEPAPTDDGRSLYLLLQHIEISALAE